MQTDAMLTTIPLQGVGLFQQVSLLTFNVDSESAAGLAIIPICTCAQLLTMYELLTGDLN